ncbi:RNA-binding S4 domain-containing protein [Pelagibacterium halotolerans]|uniref:RNA-binding S4 domain protein n=1 Tax=Pelagibacterium halotolerans (strain DSM 22347 / JCM 15775 / CGMCC 1.7692 / B2) TaxID=1082931 RepID=G4REZ7_PELHB|nr:RNA-binding S4 domain-containing protein [Pelagibacterium halotolerans]AEQ52930.1 RNA-binding S4 domain protein [Pelagibacterium halotolerans B2]QJR17401.1 RNA-binding S4 domain-containing protein [Pelagibacterium halotolerans]SEA73296.1 heat shock protein Hsp15 [Pelagibacterium halotolerans]
MPAETPDRQRLDKWLWHARITKTRTLAQKLIESGAVRVNGQRVLDTDRKVGAGDGLTIQIHTRLKVLRIAALAERRGSATVAATLYADISPQGIPEKVAPTFSVRKPEN